MYDFPVPGGPNSKIPRHGFREPKIFNSLKRFQNFDLTKYNH